MTYAMDEAVGNITEAFKRYGLWEDTLLIFSSGGFHMAPVHLFIYCLFIVNLFVHDQLLDRTPPYQ